MNENMWQWMMIEDHSDFIVYPVAGGAVLFC